MEEVESEGDIGRQRDNAEDLSHTELDEFPMFLLSPKAEAIESLQLDHNYIDTIPPVISQFTNLVTIDISNNFLCHICDEIINLKNLRTLIAKNNRLQTKFIPKDFGLMRSLEVLNLSGNDIEQFPQQLTEISTLKRLYLGGNKVSELPSSIKEMRRLEVLYLGGNALTEIPAEVGYLHRLTALVLCDNKLQSLPPTLINLRRLQSLSLHNNQLSTLPTEIVSLNLVELSLRNNPLVVKFVQDLVYCTPSLLELAGRVVKIEKIKYNKAEELPANLVNYLDSAQRCVNPKCKGVYFSSCVENVKFVDFCGKYRLPLLQYLCSPKCRTSQPKVCYSSDDTDDEDSATARMRRVLLG